MPARRAICHITTRTFALDEKSAAFLPEDCFSTRLPCRVRTEADTLTLSYTESGEGRVDTRIECAQDTVTLSRRGDVNFTARLEAGCATPAPYSVGAYAFDTVCTLESLCVQEAPLSIVIAYRMDVDGNQRKIELTVREEASP